jgi:hypothetical protein
MSFLTLKMYKIVQTTTSTNLTSNLYFKKLEKISPLKFWYGSGTGSALDTVNKFVNLDPEWWIRIAVFRDPQLRKIPQYFFIIFETTKIFLVVLEGSVSDPP